MLKAWHVFVLIVAVNLAFYAIASKGFTETDKGQFILFLGYIPVFICRAIHKHYPNQYENKSIVANISILLSLFYPLLIHLFVLTYIISGDLNLLTGDPGLGHLYVAVLFITTGLIVANSFFMINFGFLLKEFNIGSFTVMVLVVLFNLIFILLWQNLS